MDPPTSSSSSTLSQGLNHVHIPKTKPQHHSETIQSPTTPKTTNTTIFDESCLSRSSSSPNKASILATDAKNSPSNQKLYNISSGYASSQPSKSHHHHPPPLHKSRNAAKIIKGEIHNVLTVMRSDPRYYSTGVGEVNTSSGSGSNSASKRSSSSSQSRFEYEERQHTAGRVRFWAGVTNNNNNNNNNNDWRANGNTRLGTISSHPILQGLRDLHDLLSVVEVEAGNSILGSNGVSSKTKSQMNAVTFVTPFAAAVQSSDVDAKTTGEALSALHKFIVYGFIGGHDGVVEEYDTYSTSSSRFPFSSSSDKIRESISVVAQCIRHCSFENRMASKTSATPKGMFFSFWSSSEDGKQKQGSNPILGQRESTVDVSESHELPSFLIKKRRTKTSSAGKGSGSISAKKSKEPKLYSSLSPSDEDVVLKLLSLSVQVLRCPAGRTLLPPVDVVGIFDTCLHVAIEAGEANRSLLRSAAADALSHCVIVVFGMRGQAPKKRHPSNRNELNVDDDTDEQTNEDATDSDDDWGERDPTMEDHVNDSLVAETSSVKPDLAPRKVDNEDVDIDTAASTTEASNTNAIPQEVEPALVAIMHRLAALADPLLHEDETCVLALSLVNIALETMSDVDALSVRYPRLLTIMQNDLCRNLLRLSTSTDLSILGLSLRVIFNLFNSIKDHLKVQLEVFLTSVHLRILSFSTNPTTKERVWSSPPERRELALESLLEFCREPMLMADLYLNYDCDMECTNLFETISSTLAKVANPDDETADQPGSTDNSDKESALTSNDDESSRSTRLNILNRLALEGVLAVIDGIARRCHSTSKHEGTIPETAVIKQENPIGNTLYINNNESIMEGSESVNDSEYDFCSIQSSNNFALPERCDSEMSQNDIEWLSKARYHTSLALRAKKMRKRKMAKAAVEFNERSRDKEWIAEAERIGVLPTPSTPSSIASFLFSTPKLDKVKIGLYISKGPKDKYPFISEVLENFASLFDFAGMSFSEALRTFLGTFRLPGEAQCIDRLMETFATRLYQVQLATTSSNDNDQSVEKAMIEPPRRGILDDELSGPSGTLDPPGTASDDANPVFPFKSSDAAFILSFSTIMLNTDLHNPNMQDEKRMTLEQFIRNNRGINDGEDLPIDFLTGLYYEIKNSEIQVKKDLLQEGAGGADSFDGMLAKAAEVATPFFTTNHSSQLKFVSAGIHERDMFMSISSAAINAISAVFVESWDDVLVTKALDGLRNSAYICSYFGLNDQFNQILELLLGFGLDYVQSVTTLVTQPASKSADSKPTTDNRTEKVVSDLEAELVSRDIPALPRSFLLTLKPKQNVVNENNHIDIADMAGSAAHRGLISLQCALSLSKRHLSFVNEAWPMLLDVIFSLRDVNALPFRLSDLDDFADSTGNPLPSSVFANESQKRVNEYMASIAPSDEPSRKAGFLSSFFGFGQQSSHDGDESLDNNIQKLFPLSETLKRVADCAQLEKIIMKTDDVSVAKRILVSMLGCMLPDGDDEEITADSLFEHNSSFVLELAARLLISNRIHAATLYPIFLTKFQQLISPKQVDSEGPSESIILGLNYPYLLERIVVTILRSCIHLFDVPEPNLRDQLNLSLNLIATLPSSYTRTISDRIGCGAAIILRGCFYLFDDSSDDWSTIKSLLDLAAQDNSGRGFVFDGIASVIDSIDYAIPSTEGKKGQSDEINSSVQLSQCGVEVMASLLLKFMNGSYEEDLSFKVPAMMYIKKVYSFSQHFDDGGSASNRAHLKENEFETMVTAIYKDACLSDEGLTARRGFESLQGIVLSTKVESLPVSKWFAFLQLVATNPPGIECQEARISALTLIGRLFLTLMPDLSNEKENWSELEDWTILVASIVSDNLQAGRASPLFETTVQTITNIVNVMNLSGFNIGEGVDFCSWVGETLLYELEKVGASGGATSMMTAARGNTPS